MKEENEAYVGEKRGSPRGTVGKGGFNRTLFRVFMLPWWQHTKEMVWELGQTCEADGNGIIMKKIQLPSFLPDILLEEIMQKFGIFGRIIV